MMKAWLWLTCVAISASAFRPRLSPSPSTTNLRACAGLLRSLEVDRVGVGYPELLHCSAMRPHGAMMRNPIRGRAVRMGIKEWLDDIFGGDIPEEQIKGAVLYLTRAEGVKVKCLIGSSVAKSAGGTGTLANRADPSSIVDLDIPIRFEGGRKDQYGEVTGGLNLTEPNKLFIAGEGCEWKYDPYDKNVEWNLRAPDGLVLGDDVLIPPGKVRFVANAYWQESGRMLFADGRITVNEDIDAFGILAETKISGTFDIFPALSEGLS